MKFHTASALMAAILQFERGPMAAAASYGCLEAKMSSSNGDTYPDANGFVTVCFNRELSSETGGSMNMYVADLKASTTGGVHIHLGTSCADSAQGGHYFKSDDPWFNAVNPTIAPTGAGYTTDADGIGRADFKFDQGYGYDDTVGKVVVIHDTVQSLNGTYARIACGVLAAADARAIGTDQYYVDYINFKCVKDCEGSKPCGGIRNTWNTLYSSASECCSSALWWVDDTSDCFPG